MQSSPNGIRTRVATLRGRAGSLRRDPARPAVSRFRTSEWPPSTVDATNRAVKGHHATELLGGMLGFSKVRRTLRIIPARPLAGFQVDVDEIDPRSTEPVGGRRWNVINLCLTFR